MLGELGAQRRRENAADQQAGSRDGEALPAQMKEEGDADRQGQQELGGVDRADGGARVSPLQQQIGGNDRPPSAAAARIEKAADQPQRGYDARIAGAMDDMGAAPDQPQADGCQIGQHQRLDDAAVDIGQQIGPGYAADHAGNGKASKQLPVDIAMIDVADARHGGGKGFRRMDTCRCEFGRNAHGEQQCA